TMQSAAPDTGHLRPLALPIRRHPAETTSAYYHLRSPRVACLRAALCRWQALGATLAVTYLGSVTWDVVSVWEHGGSLTLASVLYCLQLEHTPPIVAAHAALAAGVAVLLLAGYAALVTRAIRAERRERAQAGYYAHMRPLIEGLEAWPRPPVRLYQPPSGPL